MTTIKIEKVVQTTSIKELFIPDLSIVNICDGYSSSELGCFEQDCDDCILKPVNWETFRSSFEDK